MASVMSFTKTMPVWISLRHCAANCQARCFGTTSVQHYLFIKTRPQKTKYPNFKRPRNMKMNLDMMPWKPGEEVKPPVDEKYEKGRLKEEDRGVKLYAVWRHRTIRKKTWMEREVLAELGLELQVKREEMVVLPNTPSVLKKLWQVKHLVQMVPITFPYGEPTQEDVEHVLLKRNGEMLVTKQLKVDKPNTEHLKTAVTLDMIKDKVRNQWEVGDQRIEEYDPKFYLRR